MSNLPRKLQKIFGVTNSLTKIQQFGSNAAATPLLTDDLDTIQGLAAWLEGWSSATILDNSRKLPVLEELNGIHYVFSSQIGYLLQKGIPEYLSGATYYIDDITREDSGTKLYKSITDSNSGNALTDIVNWELLGDLSDLAQLSGKVILSQDDIDDEATSATGLWSSEKINEVSALTTVYIRSEADFPAAVIAPDGAMRHPLEINTRYLLDIPNTGGISQLFISNGFWYPDSPNAESVNFEGNVTTQVVYLGSDAMFYSQKLGIVRHIKLILVNGLAPTKVPLYDLSGEFTLINFPILVEDNITQIGFDGSKFTNIKAYIGTTMLNSQFTAPVKFHNVLDIYTTQVVVENPLASSSNAAYVFTGTTPSVNFFNYNVLGLNSDESFVAIDAGADIGSVALSNCAFDGTSNFTQPDLTGSITAFSDLGSLISGAVTSYVDDGNGNVLVTDTTHSVYVGLTVNHTGTTNYNGNHIVTAIIDANNYVMDATYVADELSGSYTGVGTRVTSAAHNLTDHRTTDISGTTNYNGTGLEVFATTVNTFDIVTAFVVDDATGNFLTTSLNTTSPRINSRDNGAAPNSNKIAESYLNTQITVVGSGAAFTQIGGVNWIIGVAERFTISTDGVLTYTGINPSNFIIHTTATVSKVGGGTDAIASRARLNGVTLVQSEGRTENSSPTQITGFAVTNVSNGDTIDLSVNNVTGAADVIVDLASILLIGE